VRTRKNQGTEEQHHSLFDVVTK